MRIVKRPALKKTGVLRVETPKTPVGFTYRACVVCLEFDSTNGANVRACTALDAGIGID